MRGILQEISRTASVVLCTMAVFVLGVLPLTANAIEADPGNTPSPTPVVLDTTIAYGNTDVPKIYPRSVWETTQDLKNLLTWLPVDPNTPPDYNRVERVVVHDQGCLNPETCTQNATNYPIATIQNIYRFHSVTKGWGDIGYNFILDRQGRIFEGRYGGNGVRGAHLYKDSTCENFNVGTAGILLLGDLRAGPMALEQEKSLGRLTSWLCATNGFDPTSINLATTVWRSPRGTTGTCDLSQGDFSGAFIGPTLLSHGDIEAGSDTFSVAASRQIAGMSTPTLAQMLWQAEGATQVYSIRDSVLTVANGTEATVTTILRTRLDLFPQSTIVNLPDGTLVKSTTRDRVYHIEAGKRRAIPSAELFTSLGYQWTTIQTVPDRQLALWAIGDPLPFPNGTLVKGAKEKIYNFDGGKLRHITSATLFTFLKYSWSAFKILADTDIATFQETSPMKFPSDTLIRGVTPTVYLIDGEVKRPIASAVLFLARGFKWTTVQNLTMSETVLYETGPLMLWPDGSLIRGPDSKVYWIQKGYRRWIQTADAFKQAGFAWTTVKAVSAVEITVHHEAQPITSKADLSVEPQAITPPPTPPPAPTPLGEPTIRIGLKELSAGTAVQVSYDGAFDVFKNGTLFTTQNAGDIASITPNVGETWRFVPKNTFNISTVPSYTDLAWNGTNDNRFRGIIEVTTSTQ